MKWVDVHSEWPPANTPVLLYAYLGTVHVDYSEELSPDCIFTGYWDSKHKYWASNVGDGWVPFDKEEVTHWMKLPKGPRDL